MKLKYLTLEASKELKFPQNYMPFNWIGHHVKEIYLKLFPKNIEINKSKKIAIIFGPLGNETVWNNVLGVTSYYVEDFDFNSFYGLNKNEQENIVLENINNVIIEIYRRAGENEDEIQAIINTANKVKEMKFNMEFEMKQLSKITLDKEYKIMICRIFNKDVGEGWKYKKINMKTKEIAEEYWMNNIPDYLDLSDYYKKSEIKGKEYMLYDNIGRMVYKITDEEYLQYDYKRNINKRIKK